MKYDSWSIIQWKAPDLVEPIAVSVRVSKFRPSVAYFMLSSYHLQQFPYSPYRVDLFLDNVSGFLPILLVMAFIYSAGIIVKVISLTFTYFVDVVVVV